MMDGFAEYAVKAKTEKSFYVKMVLAIWVTFLGIPLLFFVGGIGLIVSVVGICLIVYFWGLRNVEYEYTFTNGSVEIAAIYGSSKRKERMKFELEQVKQIVPSDSLRLGQNNYSKRHDFTSGKQKGVTFVVEINGQQELVTLELNERCMKHLKQFAKDKMYDL